MGRRKYITLNQHNYLYIYLLEIIEKLKISKEQTENFKKILIHYKTSKFKNITFDDFCLFSKKIGLSVEKLQNFSDFSQHKKIFDTYKNIDAKQELKININEKKVDKEQKNIEYDNFVLKSLRNEDINKLIREFLRKKRENIKISETAFIEKVKYPKKTIKNFEYKNISQNIKLIKAYCKAINYNYKELGNLLNKYLNTKNKSLKEKKNNSPKFKKQKQNNILDQMKLYDKQIREIINKKIVDDEFSTDYLAEKNLISKSYLSKWRNTALPRNIEKVTFLCKSLGLDINTIITDLSKKEQKKHSTLYNYLKNKEHNAAIREIIQRQMNKKNIDLNYISEKIGVKYSTLKKWINKNIPQKPKKIIDIFDILKLNLLELDDRIINIFAKAVKKPKDKTEKEKQLNPQLLTKNKEKKQEELKPISKKTDKDKVIIKKQEPKVNSYLDYTEKTLQDKTKALIDSIFNENISIEEESSDIKQSLKIIRQYRLYTLLLETMIKEKDEIINQNKK